MLDQMWNAALVAANPMFLELLLVICYALYSKRVALNIFFLLLLGMTVNAYLKELWQIPWHPGSNKYSFPSGHMNAASIVYLSLALQMRKWWVWGGGIAMMAIAAVGINHAGHHTWPELFAGFCLAGIISLSFWYVHKHLRLRPYQYGVIFFIAQFVTIVVFLPFNPRLFFLWDMLCLNMGVNAGYLLFNRASHLDNSVRVLLMLFIISCSALISHSEHELVANGPIKHASQYFMFGTFFAFAAPFIERRGRVTRMHYQYKFQFDPDT